MKQQHLARAIAAALVLITAAPLAHAVQARWDTGLAGSSGTGAPGAPWISTYAPGSHYAEWNVMEDSNTATLPITDSTPDVGAFNAAGVLLTETTGTAFVTSGGNMYSPMAPTAFTLALPASGVFDQVWLRISTVGTAPASTATLEGIGASAVQTFSQVVTGGFGGTELEWYWKWTDVSTTGGALNFAFAASGSSMSLDQVAVYAVPVPEPGTWALMAVGLAGLGLARRRRG
jgi:hypothetical protein